MMGFRFSSDGLCIECGYYTQEFCDACGRHICPEHMHFKDVRNSKIMKHVLCRECIDKRTDKWFMHRSCMNTKFLHLAHTNYFTVPDS